MPGVPLHGSYSYKKKKEPKAERLPSVTESEWEGGFDVVIDFTTTTTLALRAYQLIPVQP